MTIKDNKELEIAETQLNQFRTKLTELEKKRDGGIEETLIQIEINIINSKIEELKENIDNYKNTMHDDM